MVTERKISTNGNGFHLEDSKERPEITDPVTIYLQEIGRFRLLEAQEEIDLSKVIRRGQISFEILRQNSDDETSLASTFISANNLSPTFSHSPFKNSDLNSEETIKEIQHLELDIDTQHENLAQSAQNAIKSHEDLVNSNYRLVVTVAKKQIQSHLKMMDYIQEGNRGLMTAAAKYDYRKGFKFSTYATWWIRQSIGRARYDMEYPIRRPVHIEEAVSKLDKTEDRMLVETGEIDDVKLAHSLGFTEEKIQELRRARNLGLVISIDNPTTIFGDSYTSATDKQAILAKATDEKTEDEAIETDHCKQIRGAIQSSLNEDEYKLIDLRFGLSDGRSRTLEEVGKEFGVTRERIRQKETKIFRKLRLTLAKSGFAE